MRKAKWYVYSLVDPRDSSIFYIGKGSGYRIDDHEREAIRGVCSKKCNKIRSITDSGLKIIKEKLAVFWNEQDAYDFETDCIAEIGLSNLTNVMPGGQKAFIRRVLKRKDSKPSPPLMSTIEKSAGHLAYWLKGYKKPDGLAGFAKFVYDSADKYFPKMMEMGLKENPEKMREILSYYGISLIWQPEKIEA